MLVVESEGSWVKVISMVALWGIGDTHFWHWNIGRPDYCNRPDDWQELIIERWNAVVQPRDWVLHVGDFAFGRDATLERVKETRARLNGRILLVWGNHEGRICKIHTWREIVGVDAIMREHGDIHDLGKYRFVCLQSRPGQSKPAWKKRVVFVSHRPIRNQVQMPYFYGHIHNSEDPEQYPGRCLCVEVNDYRPVRLAADVEH